MPITLYHFNNSVCSEKVRLVLNEKGVTGWTSKEVDLFKSEQFDPDYLKLNPKGVVPTLVDENGVLVESTLIAEYLDELYLDPPLKPAAPFDRAQMRLYSKACDEGLHQGVAVLSYAAMFMDRLRKKPAAELQQHFNRIIDLDRRDRQMAISEHGVEAPHVFRGVIAFEKAFQKIEKALSDGRQWLVGGGFSLAEVNLVPYVARLEYLDLLDVWMAERPGVLDWYRRIQDRPSYKAEVIDWIREEEWNEMQTAGARIKPRVAAFRDTYLSTDFGAQIF